MINAEVSQKNILNSNSQTTHNDEENNKLMTVLSFVPAIFGDLCLLPFAAGLAGASILGYNFNPRVIKKGVPTIVLLHGSGFNESEFIVAREYLDKEKYGSVISFNLEGFLNLMPDSETGIDDIINRVVRNTFKKIVQITKCNTLIPIGHSIGGMIAADYAENLSEEDGINMEHVFTVCSPVKGTPTLDFIWSHISKNLKNSKRNHQMCKSGDYWPQLCQKALKSEQEGKRKYYSIYSGADWAVPFESGKLTENPDRILAYKIAGHYAPIALPTTWNWVTSKLDEIYNIQNENQYEIIKLPRNWNWVTSKLDDKHNPNYKTFVFKVALIAFLFFIRSRY